MFKKLFLFALLISFSLVAEAASTMSINGSVPQNVTNMSVDGLTALYNSSGLVPASVSPKIWVGYVTVTGTGSVNWSSAGFTTIVYSFAQAISTGVTNNTLFNASLVSPSTTGATINVLTPTVAVLGNLPYVAATTSAVVNVVAVGW